MSTALASARINVANAKIIVGNVGTPGAPIVHFTLALAEGAVGGIAHITQALQSPNSDYTFPVVGRVYHAGLGQDMMLISLDGQFVVAASPPAIGAYLAEFHASLAVEHNWTGQGGFSYGHTQVQNAPVKPEA